MPINEINNFLIRLLIEKDFENKSKLLENISNDILLKTKIFNKDDFFKIFTTILNSLRNNFIVDSKVFIDSIFRLINILKYKYGKNNFNTEIIKIIPYIHKENKYLLDSLNLIINEDSFDSESKQSFFTIFSSEFDLDDDDENEKSDEEDNIVNPRRSMLSLDSLLSK